MDINIYEFLYIAIIMLIFDYIWLGHVTKGIWYNVVKDIQKEPFNAKLFYGIPAYLLMVISILVFVLPKISKENMIYDSIIYGGLMGLIIYGVFDFTNLVLFKNYNLNVAMLDILWGIVLFIITTYISKKYIISNN